MPNTRCKKRRFARRKSQVYLPASVSGASFQKEILTGSLLVQVQPGRSALLWPPRLIFGEPHETARHLIDTALQTLAETDVRIVQALLLTDAGEDAEVFALPASAIFPICFTWFAWTVTSPQFRSRLAHSRRVLNS